MSDMQDVMTRYENHAKALAAATTLNKSAIFEALAASRISLVTVNFDGEGDSGQIEGVTAFIDDKPQPIPKMSIPFHHVPWESAEAKVSQVKLTDAIKDLCYAYLSQEHGGWENNDGAFGEFTLSVSNRTVELEFNGRFSDFNTSTHTF